MRWAGGTYAQTKRQLREMEDGASEGRLERLLRFLRVKRWEKSSQGQRKREAEWERVERRYRKRVEKENRKMGLSQ